MATGYTPPTMNWNALDVPDEFNSFKQYCNLIFDGPFLKKTEKEKASYILENTIHCKSPSPFRTGFNI